MKFPPIVLLASLSLFASVTLFPVASAEAALKCYDCHGTRNPQDVRPLDDGFRNVSTGGFVGNHRTHLPSGVPGSACAMCHPGSGSYNAAHRDGKIKISARVNNSPLITVYNNRTSAWPHTATPQLGSCSNVNCHFEQQTPQWGVDRTALSCGSCHGSPPPDGSHGKKHGAYYGTGSDSCAKCHPNHPATANSFAHATSAGRRGIIVQFATAPNIGGSYQGGTTSYPTYLPRLNPARNGSCVSTYCHSDGRGNPPNKTLSWSDSRTTDCYSCHRGRTADSTAENCAPFGVWSAAKGSCTPDLTMSTDGHHRLVGPQWIRKYPCHYCHNATVSTNGAIADPTQHVNGQKNVAIHPDWNIANRQAASYDPATQVCSNVYCHSDGTTDPEKVRPFSWNTPKTNCNSCHGHPVGSCSASSCHDGRYDAANGKYWEVKTGWPAGNEWMSAMPMFVNQGAGTPRANSHTRHVQTSFSCDICHTETVINGACTSCHAGGVPAGSMGEVAHLNGTNHVNRHKDIAFKDIGASYNSATKTCSGTSCHAGGVDPVWGGSVNSAITCLGCHRSTGPDVDDFAAFNGERAKINQLEWETTGHGRYSTAGRYSGSNNPAANFPGNPCWYCHDNSILHKDANNPFRLRMHQQYERRFEKECVYCHLERKEAECLGCHVNQTFSLAPQATAGGIVFKLPAGGTETRYPGHATTSGCLAGGCHDTDSGLFPSGARKGHNTNTGIWTAEQKDDIKNQYLMMGVCLQCHDDDSGGQCTQCHTAPADNLNKYSPGFDPGSGFVKPKKAKATSAHFGYKHYRSFLLSGGWTKDVNGKVTGVWKGGKFCWDCHDPHGDSNIYMIQKKVATATEGRFGTPKTRADVTFVNKDSGSSYARKTAPFDGICNVCHPTGGRHYTNSAGDGHNYTRVCTTCHEHRFTDSHANKQACNSCHSNSKPVPKHTAFSLPRDCTKCHFGTVGKRMDIMGQMRSNSHHVQGVEVTNKHCYACHWEATSTGLVNLTYHAGYNYKTYTSVKNDPVDLVIWGPGVRPTGYREFSSATGRPSVTRFLAVGVGTPSERSEVGKITNHCLGCHSDQNNDTEPFGDYRRPRQYAWDYQSVAARYSQTGTTAWGKYNSATYPAANKKDTVTKAFSAHGNAVANLGGWSTATGYDGTITPTRGGAGAASVQCFDCHNSHGSKVVGVTTSYVTFNGTNNGGNLKETKKDIGGYSYDYKASANSSGVNPYGSGAGQCFDCHISAASGTVTPNGKTPWGYGTFGATAPILGYKDTERFGQGTKGSTVRFAERDSMKTIVGGHLSASEPSGAQPHLAKELGTASGGAADTMADATKSWTVDRWKNLYLQLTGGANAGQMRKITANSATTLAVEPFVSPVAIGDSYRIIPYTNQVNGLCTPCHDPHGVSPALGDRQKNAVPLLKGTWLTSPYQEDQPPPDPTGNNVTNGPDGVPRSWSRQYSGPYPTQPSARYNLDRTTFGGNTRIAEQDDRFAGLCTNCHQKQALTDGTNKNQSWKSVDRIHESVKGWGANTEHSYSCSKCHQPHNSGLPRLMQTSCLDAKHRGNRATGGTPWSADSQTPGMAHSVGNQHRGYPVASTYGNSASYEATASCHGSASQNNGTWPQKNLWNSVTPW